jgi:HSP20 family protein
MKYIKVRFGKNLGHVHSRLQRTIDEMFQQVKPVLVLPEQTWRPQIDMYETPQEITILVNVPGVDKEDLEVEVEEKAIRIKGVRHERARVPDMKYHLAEIDFGRFERILFLPSPVHPEDVEATCANGVLKIIAGKASLQKARQISIENK